MNNSRSNEAEEALILEYIGEMVLAEIQESSPNLCEELAIARAKIHDNADSIHITDDQVHKPSMLNNEKLVAALKNLVKELESEKTESGFQTCNSCRFGTDNSLTVFDMHCQIGYAYDTLSNVLSLLEDLSSKQSKVS